MQIGFQEFDGALFLYLRFKSRFKSFISVKILEIELLSFSPLFSSQLDNLPDIFLYDVNWARKKKYNARICSENNGSFSFHVEIFCQWYALFWYVIYLNDLQMLSLTLCVCVCVYSIYFIQQPSFINAGDVKSCHEEIFCCNIERSQLITRSLQTAMEIRFPNLSKIRGSIVKLILFFFIHL